MIVATEIDGGPLSLGGLGPQWAIYDADRLAALGQAAQGTLCAVPLGLLSIEVTRS